MVSPPRAAAVAIFLILLALSAQTGAGLANVSLSGLPQTGWRIDIANMDVPNSISPVSLAVDSQGQPHATFEDLDTSGSTYSAYAYRTPLGWTAPIELGKRSYGPRLAIDSAGARHFAWSSTESSESATYYAVLAGTTLVKEELDPVIAELRSISLVLDDADVPHVTYAHGYCGLHYAARDPASGVWSKELIEGGCGTGLWNDLELDSQGRIHVAYRVYSAGLK